MSMPTPDHQDFLGMVATVAIALVSAIAGAFATAFASGKRFGEILTRLDTIDQRTNRIEDRLNKHLDKQ